MTHAEMLLCSPPHDAARSITPPREPAQALGMILATRPAGPGALAGLAGAPRLPFLIALEPAGAERARILRSVVESAAHDLANLLTLMGFDLDALRSVPLPPKAADALGSLRAEAAHLRGMANELRMAAAESAWETEEPRTRLAAWWPSVRTLLQSTHRESVTVRAHIPWGLPPVRIDAYRLTQIVLNLVGNAAHSIAENVRTLAPLDASPGGRARGTVDISASLLGPGVVGLSVTDNGAGMSREVLEKASEPFFTTRADLGGSGLGLAMVQRLVGDVGGRVRITSVPGAGASITIELPTSDPLPISRGSIRVSAVLAAADSTRATAAKHGATTDAPPAIDESLPARQRTPAGSMEALTTSRRETDAMKSA